MTQTMPKGSVHPGGMTSDERQKARRELLNIVNEAEAAYVEAREHAEQLRRDETAARNRADEKARILNRAQEQLRGFLLEVKL